MKLSTLFRGAARYCERPGVSPIAYHQALGVTVRGGPGRDRSPETDRVQEDADCFAREFFSGEGEPQCLTLDERVVFFGFLAAIAESEGK